MLKRIVFSGLFLAPTLALAGVNINLLDAQTLAEELDGVGLSKAQAIVEHRESHGPFMAVDDLADVKGIGPAILEKNRPVITLESE